MVFAIALVSNKLITRNRHSPLFYSSFDDALFLKSFSDFDAPSASAITTPEDWHVNSSRIETCQTRFGRVDLDQ